MASQSIKIQSVNVFTGQIIHCTKPYKLQVITKGFVAVADSGKILALGDEKDLQEVLSKSNLKAHDTVKLSKSQLLLPGFIDTHIHAPQYPNAGLGYDKPLLEWLDHYTYKLEKQYTDQELCKTVFNAVVRKTLDHGTTTACYFASLFLNSSLVLAEAVAKYGQRALIGKVNMIKLAPDDYVETPEASIENTRKFVEAINDLKNSLIQPVVTPRFALSVDMAHMKNLAKIAEEFGLHIQSHISENKSEIEMIHETYHTSYANVYYEAGLLGEKTVLAHGVHLTDDELDLLEKTKTAISHCPESNTCLQSGLCNVNRLKEHGITVGLGTDISGGPSCSIISAMKSAVATSIHLSYKFDDYKPLTYEDAFYLATLGGAKALALDKEIGNFEVGKSFDALIVDMDVEHSSADFLSSDLTPEELLQKLVFLGDDRNIIKVFVNGKCVKN